MLSKIQIKFTNGTKNSTSVVAGIPRPTPQKWLEILKKFYKNLYKYSTNISVRVFIVIGLFLSLQAKFDELCPIQRLQCFLSISFSHNVNKNVTGLKGY